MSEGAGIFSLIAGVILVVVVLAGGTCALQPRYRIWSEGMAGQAVLARAEYERKVQIEEARGRKEAATLLAEAEVERAKGVAESNKIIGDSLKEGEAYLRYLWIQSLSDKTSPTVVYIPTEAGLPILESSRHFLKQGE